MNTKNILKTLALAVVLTSACGKNEMANEANADGKGYTIPVTVNVTRQDGEATKAAYNGTSKKLEFSTGDKLFVNGFYDTYNRFAGTLSYASDGKFSGTISTETEWTGTADALLSAGQNVQAFLLPAGYESYGFVSIEKATDPLYDQCAYDYTKAIALTKAAGVEQLSREYTSSYASGFALAPKNAILNFTIPELTASTEVAVVFSYPSATVSKTVTTDAAGNANFAIGVPDGTDYNTCSLTVGGNAITLGDGSSKTLAAGKIYNIYQTLIWDSSNVFNAAHEGDMIDPYRLDPLTYAGITISLSGTYSTFFPYFPEGEDHKGILRVFVDSESFTFTAPSGKKFTKIEIINKDSNMAVNDVNWSRQDNKAIWNGSPSNTVSIGGEGTNFDNLNSIIFILCKGE